MRAIFVDPVSAKPTTGKPVVLDLAQEASLLTTLALETAIVHCNKTKDAMNEELLKECRVVMSNELKALDRRNCVIGVFVKDGSIHLSRKK